MGSISRQNISFDDALDLVLRQIEPLAPVALGLDESIGLIASESVFSRFDSPAFPTIAMDGYAVRTSDILEARPDNRIRLIVKGTLGAGQRDALTVEPGQCLHVMTGARCPVETDAVLPWEVVSQDGDAIWVSSAVPSGHHIRKVGEISQAGQEIVPKGTVLAPAHLGLLASNGMGTVRVAPRPRVALITVGDELVEPGDAIGETSIPDSNSIVISALIRQFGGSLMDRSRCPDDTESVRMRLAELRTGKPDLIVTVGGASGSERDVLSRLTGSGIDLHALDVRMRPGRPLVTGLVQGIPLIGLPGNPGAAFNSAWQFVRPTIRRLIGDGEPVLAVVKVACGFDVADVAGRRSYLRVRFEQRNGQIWAMPAGSQSSADQGSLAETDGFAVIEEDVVTVAIGQMISVQVINPSARWLASS